MGVLRRYPIELALVVLGVTCLIAPELKADPANFCLTQCMEKTEPLLTSGAGTTCSYTDVSSCWVCRGAATAYCVWPSPLRPTDVRCGVSDDTLNNNIKMKIIPYVRKPGAAADAALCTKKCDAANIRVTSGDDSEATVTADAVADPNNATVDLLLTCPPAPANTDG